MTIVRTWIKKKKKTSLEIKTFLYIYIDVIILRSMLLASEVLISIRSESFYFQSIKLKVIFIISKCYNYFIIIIYSETYLGVVIFLM